MEAAAGLDLAALHDVLGRTAARLAGSIQQGDVTPAQCNSCAKHCGNELYTVELRAPFAPNCLNYLSPVSQLLTGPSAKTKNILHVESFLQPDCVPLLPSAWAPTESCTCAGRRTDRANRATA